MPAIVNSVNIDSIAQEIGLCEGDEIIFINGEKPADFFDYKYLMSSEDIELHIKKTDGTEEIIEIEKDFDEDLGITFESAVFDRVKPCANKCIFCFVDQQPKGLRESLYIKDDDYRLSYLHGTYITLTNLTKQDRQRIEALRPGPLYISVHTTNPDLRVKMLGNKKAGKIFDELKWLDSLDIPMHTQIVLCPDFNDGKELEKTIKDLLKLKNNIHSIAIVPVGLTKYRQEDNLKPVSKEKALETIVVADKFNQKFLKNIVNVSDEFYIIAGLDFPDKNYYNGFNQLDDGVGSSRVLLDDFEKHKKKLPKALAKKQIFAIATGEIAAQTLEKIAKELNKIKNLTVEVMPVKSNFWGENVTVSGLITGKDLLTAFKGLKNKYDKVFVPSVMIKPYSESFLDNITISQVSEKIGEIVVIKDYYSTKELVMFVRGLKN